MIRASPIQNVPKNTNSTSVNDVKKKPIGSAILASPSPIALPFEMSQIRKKGAAKENPYTNGNMLCELYASTHAIINAMIVKGLDKYSGTSKFSRSCIAIGNRNSDKNIQIKNTRYELANINEIRNSIPIPTSARKVCVGILFPQFLHLPVSAIYETKGINSYHFNVLLQLMQMDLSVKDLDHFPLERTTSIKLPRSNPNTLIIISVSVYGSSIIKSSYINIKAFLKCETSILKI